MSIRTDITITMSKILAYMVTIMGFILCIMILRGVIITDGEITIKVIGKVIGLFGSSVGSAITLYANKHYQDRKKNGK